jgi:hypothetical protein
MLSFLGETPRRPRLSVGLLGRGQAGLSLSDGSGESTLSVTVDAEGGAPSIVMLDKAKSDTQVLMGIREEGLSLVLSEEKRGRISMHIDEDGVPTFRLQSAGKEREIYMSADRSGPKISCTSKNGEKGTDWFLDRRGTPSLRVTDRAANVNYVISLDKGGKPSVTNFGAQPAR